MLIITFRIRLEKLKQFFIVFKYVELDNRKPRTF